MLLARTRKRHRTKGLRAGRGEGFFSLHFDDAGFCGIGVVLVAPRACRVEGELPEFLRFERGARIKSACAAVRLSRIDIPTGKRGGSDPESAAGVVGEAHG